jgi:hypothetical protein
MGTCRICDRPVHGKGLCRPHLRRANKGLPLDVPIRRAGAMDTLADRFLDLVVITDHGVEWNGSRDAAGYGRVTIKGKFWLAHRLAWHLVRGPIPEGMQVDHLPTCPSSCVTVGHLQLLSISDHTSLGWQRGELEGWQGARTLPERPKGIDRVPMRPRRGRVVHDG